MAGGKRRFGHALSVAAFIVVFVAVVALLSATAGCSTHSYLYRPVPERMIPKKPKTQKIGRAEIPRCEAEQKPCMKDETYVKLVENDRALKQQINELRALLGAGDEPTDR